MTRKRQDPDDAVELRRLAEERMKARGGSREVLPAVDEVERLVHDLRVHQVELEMQNEELRNIQEQLVAERGRYFDLFELAPVGYLTVDGDGAIVEANLTAASLLGLSRAEIVGRQLTSFIVSADQDIHYLHRRRLETGGTADVCELRLVQKDAEPRWVALSTVAAREPDGSPVWRAVINDITLRKQAELEIEQGRARLMEAQKLEAMGRLAGGVAHNFNNILQTLSSLSALLALRSRTPEVAGSVEQIDAQIRRGAAFARQLLTFAPDHPLAKAPVDLRGLVESMAPTLRAALPENVRLSVGSRDDSSPLWVEGDATGLEQVVTNLVQNARDAMPTRGTLSIRTFSRDGFGVLEVEDTGRGIDDATREHLFEPFAAAKEARGASVRGLAFAYGIVRSHGGRIEVDSAVGRGSLLRVLLPAVAPSSVGVSNQSAAGEMLPGHGEKILLVEDEDATREVLTDLLGLLGYDVVAAGRGEDALALPDLTAPDLLLCDVLLPGIPGPALAERLRKRWPRMSVILMSGYTGDIAIPRDAAGNRARFLQKPFEMARLSRELRAALDDAPAE
ncbi:MAG: ATP-binding protein [Thermoanaerobaculia bacterium]|jgi:PAS domain S-box-containing protein